MFLYEKTCFWCDTKDVTRPLYFGYYFSLQITTILSALNLPNFRYKMIITFDVIAVDNFKAHFWNHHFMLVNIPKNEVNRREEDPHPRTHPPIHPPTHTIKHFWVSKKGGYYRVNLKRPKSVPRSIYFYGPYRGLLPHPPFRG